MDGKKQTGKRKPLDDDSDEGFGLRTPARHTERRETGKAERPARKETGKAERPTRKETGKAERPAKSDTGRAERPKKLESGKTKALEPAGEDEPKKLESGKTKALRAKGDPAPAPARAGGSKAPLVLVGLLLVAGVAGGGIWLLRPEEPSRPPTPISPAPPQVADQGGQKPPVDVEPVLTLPPPPSVGPGATPLEKPLEKLDPGSLQPLQAPGTLDKSTLEELARRSPNHAELARILEEFADLFKADLMAANPMLEDFQLRQKREEELIARIRAMGPQAAAALLDMVLGLDNRAQQIFLAKGLAGIPGQEALDAVGKVLGQNKDVAIQTTLVRFLPQDAASSALVAQAFQGEQNPHLRTMLMRELSAREQGTGGSSELFRQAALQDPDPNVRAEAVSIIGRRGEAADAAVMEQLARNEQNLQIRQRAIVSYAETAREGSLRYLEDLARDPQAGLPVRASAVLAIGRVGGDNAIRSLETIAATDPEQEIRTRAQRLAASLRARQQSEAQGPARVDEQPLRLGPGGAEAGPLQPR